MHFICQDEILKLNQEVSIFCIFFLHCHVIKYDSDQSNPIQSKFSQRVKGRFQKKNKRSEKLVLFLFESNTRSGRQFTAEEPPSRRSRKRMLRFVQIYATLGLIESVNQNQISSLDCLRNKRKHL